MGRERIEGDWGRGLRWGKGGGEERSIRAACVFDGEWSPFGHRRPPPNPPSPPPPQSPTNTPCAYHAPRHPPLRRLAHLFAPSIKMPSHSAAVVFGAGALETSVLTQASLWRMEALDEYGSEYSDSTSEDFGTEDEEIRDGAYGDGVGSLGVQ